VLEVVFQGLFDLIGYVGYRIVRTIVPLVCGKRILVAPPPNNHIVVTRWHGLHRLTDGTPVIGKRLASVLGWILLTGVILGSLIVWKMLRA
jgi:hypothetical protein